MSSNNSQSQKPSLEAIRSTLVMQLLKIFRQDPILIQGLKKSVMNTLKKDVKYELKVQYGQKTGDWIWKKLEQEMGEELSPKIMRELGEAFNKSGDVLSELSCLKSINPTSIRAYPELLVDLSFKSYDLNIISQMDKYVKAMKEEGKKVDHLAMRNYFAYMQDKNKDIDDIMVYLLKEGWLDVYATNNTDVNCVIKLYYIKLLSEANHHKLQKFATSLIFDHYVEIADIPDQVILDISLSYSPALQDYVFGFEYNLRYCLEKKLSTKHQWFMSLMRSGCLRGLLETDCVFIIDMIRKYM